MELGTENPALHWAPGRADSLGMRLEKSTDRYQDVAGRFSISGWTLDGEIKSP